MKTCVFFGAGADCDLGIPGGKDFAKAVLGIGQELMNSAVESYYKSHCPIDSEFYPNYSRQEFKDDDFLEACIRAWYLGNITPQSTKMQFEESIQEKKKELSYENHSLKIAEEREKLISEYTSYVGILDKCFPAVIQPRVLGANYFIRVVACYLRAQAYLLSKLIDEKRHTIDKSFYEELMQNPRLIASVQDDFVKENSRKTSYYSIIGEIKNKTNDEINVVTTNYTDLCQKMANLTDNQIAYVHGKFGWYESAMKNQVFDFTSGKDQLPKDDLLFPFIFVQSALKPVVDRRQIREYAKMDRFFDEADRTVVVGYNLNRDDHHINGFLRSLLLEGKEIVYLSYTDGQNREQLLNALRLREQDFLSENLIVLSISGMNAHTTFRNCLTEDVKTITKKE